MANAQESSPETPRTRSIIRTVKSRSKSIQEYQAQVHLWLASANPEADDAAYQAIQFLKADVTECEQLLDELAEQIEVDMVVLTDGHRATVDDLTKQVDAARRVALHASIAFHSIKDKALERRRAEIDTKELDEMLSSHTPTRLKMLRPRRIEEQLESPATPVWQQPSESVVDFGADILQTGRVQLATRVPNPAQIKQDRPQSATQSRSGSPASFRSMPFFPYNFLPNHEPVTHIPSAIPTPVPTIVVTTTFTPILTTTSSYLVAPTMATSTVPVLPTAYQVPNARYHPQPPIPVTTASQSAVQHRTKRVNLPKIDIPKFSGDLRKFKPFIDLHMSTIGNDTDLAPVMKLHYLNASLAGDARKVTEYLEPVDESYAIAIDLLNKTFNHPDKAISEVISRLSRIKQPNMTVQGLQRFRIEIESDLQCLQSLGEDINHAHYKDLVFKTLPREIALQMFRVKKDKSMWTMQDLRDQIADEIEAQQNASGHTDEHEEDEASCTVDALATHVRKYDKFRQPQLPKLRERSEQPHREFKNPRFTESSKFDQRFNMRQPKSGCAFCGGNHWNSDCRVYKSYHERLAQIRNANRCLRCLRTGHKVTSCQIPQGNLSCYKCRAKGSHVTAMCDDDIRPTGVLTTQAKHTESEDNAEKSNAMATLTSQIDPYRAKERFTFLETAIHQVSDVLSERPKMKIRALHDTGSNRSFVREDIAKRLKLKVTTGPQMLVDVFGAASAKMPSYKSSLRLHMSNGDKLDVEVNVVPEIMNSLKRVPLPNEVYQAIPLNIELADPPPVSPENHTVDLLIGQNAYQDIMKTKRIKVRNGPYLLESKVGWIIAGTTDGCDSQGAYCNQAVTARVQAEVCEDFEPIQTQSDAESLNKAIKDMFSLDAIGITDDPTLKEDDLALAEFNEKTVFKGNRYYVPWLWRNNAHLLPTNRKLAQKRLEGTVNKLLKEPDKLKKYDAVMKGQIELGVLEEVKTVETTNREHYISHHAVETPQKTTTKLRIVYDASAKESKSRPSLNECLYRGPLSLESLIGILLRFRMHKIALVSDIEKAFLQVGLLEEDRDVTRLFWLKNINKPNPLTEDNVAVYRFARVPFGMRASSFLLDGAIITHMTNDPGDKDIAEDIIANHYVDNVASGQTSVDEAKRYYDVSKAKFNRASMNLREWATNSQELQEYIPERDRLEGNVVKVLGIHWNTKTDEIQISTKSEKKPHQIPKKVTQRTVLSLLSQVFDPFGFLSPITIRSRIILQQFAHGNDWDKEIPEELLAEFREIHEDQLKAGEIKFPRYVADLAVAKDATLHCFCDASKKAYGAAIYMAHHNMAEPMLIYAKNRVAPKNQSTLTLPRLELMAILIGTRALRFVQESFKIQCRTYLWSDSQIALSWTDTDKVLETFVRNRVNEINKNPKPNFRYVPTAQNPADKASRGIRISELDDAWWHEPPWLSKDQGHWPKQLTNPKRKCEIEETQAEVEPKATIKVANANTTYPFLDINIDKFSDVNRLIRTTARCFKIIQLLKQKRLKPENLTELKEISTEGLLEAQKCLVRQIQRQSYTDVYNSPSKSKSAVVKQLGIFKDQEGILRCNGRLGKIDAAEETKFPALLPRKNHFTTILCENIHQNVGHSGTNYTLAEMRKSYWIPKGRVLVKQIIRRCVQCRKSSPEPFRLPPMPELPHERVKQFPPFTHTGLDYFGPLYVFDDKKESPRKTWICLFTCLTTRAIHLELVSDMTAMQFHFALRRFFATYSVPQSIISDNAPQFKTAADVLKSSMATSNEGKLKWKFIIEYAPWQGGVYERMVQIAKRAYKKVLGNSKLTETELATVTREIQEIVNNRPISNISEDPADLKALTPNDFLYPYHRRPAGGLTESTTLYEKGNSTAKNLAKMWQKTQDLLQQFWEQWNNDYLLSLREAVKWTHKCGKRVTNSTPRVGQVVLVKNPTVHIKVKWNMARVQSLIRSNDGMFRAATIRLPNGSILKRPINLLSPLECQIEENSLHQVNDIRQEENQPTRIQPYRACKAKVTGK